ncbi:pyrroloquinoline quinone-dependent dehydrogenase [Tardiphaga sp. OK245]|uniref:pyrroloquinoline quinone-dependent dehydrogenase n=1 Tax=Tardiphaga sp. OK245 TaxID=1855306 RepID=UPI0008A790CB|nr:pyrroloquinoline quinone-dependent dehydrogenase [Tardiphaga sp. OK245]SEH87877.1 quinoprotein glucose dehydrogenase [Tardiphaga sp. OK245]
MNFFKKSCLHESRVAVRKRCAAPIETQIIKTRVPKPALDIETSFRRAVEAVEEIALTSKMRAVLLRVNSPLSLSAFGLSVCLGLTTVANSASRLGDWPEYMADKAASNYTPADSVTLSSVKKFKLAWRIDLPGNQISEKNPELRTWVNESTPIAIDGVLYATSPLSIVSAIDGATGKTLWSYDPMAYVDGTPPNLGFISRGLGYWQEGDDKRIFLGTGDAYLIALDARTGKPIESWGDHGRVDLTKGLRRPVDRSLVAVTSAPMVCGGRVISPLAILDSFAIGRSPMKHHPPGDVRGFDVKTGKQSWIFHAPPQPDEPGNETWENGSWEFAGGMNMWTRPSCDEELGLVYLPLSTPSNDFFGGWRKGDGLYGESLVALNANSGKKAWHFQFVHHGLWDYDLTTAPNLMDLTVDGKIIKAAVQLTKQGFVYAFDRTNGKPIWPIEERPVPKSTIPSERASPTQPFPTWPQPYVQQGSTEDDLIDLTPELKEQAKKIYSRYNTGPLFTPPSEDKSGTLQVPGVLGGVSWVGAAHNPKTNILYVPSFTIPFGIKLKKEVAGVYEYTGTWAGVGGPQGLPLFKPPFSTVTAYNMDTGKQLWRIPAGRGPIDSPALRGLKLDRLGVPRQSHILLTDNVLFIAPEGTNSVIGLSSRGNALITQATADESEPFLYAHDAKTGELISELRLPGAAFGNLMAYAAGGKRFLVVPIGGAGLPSQLVAVQID